MRQPVLRIDLAKIGENAGLAAEMLAQSQVRLTAVTKAVLGSPEVGRAMLEGGAGALADSRLENLFKLRMAGLNRHPWTGHAVPLYLLRLPMISQARAVVETADGSLNSEIDTIRALGEAARAAGRTHRIILMVDLGDLREGVWADQALETALAADTVPGIELEGLGTNFACFGGVVPTPENLSRLAGLAEETGRRLGRKVTVVSGGNSSSLGLVLAGRLPEGITDLRIGEGILLGCETINRDPIPGAHLDAFVISAEVIEVRDKPSVPPGPVGQDAFGGRPEFRDRGIRRRAVLALGRQDAVPQGLQPLLAGIEVLGASSDHLVLDVTECPEPIRVGGVMEFLPRYGCLLAAATSPFVEKVYV